MNNSKQSAEDYAINLAKQKYGEYCITWMNDNTYASRKVVLDFIDARISDYKSAQSLVADVQPSKSSTEFFEPSAYEAVEQSTKLLAQHLHNNRISISSRAVLVDLHNACQLLLSKLELDL